MSAAPSSTPPFRSDADTGPDEARRLATEHRVLALCACLGMLPLLHLAVSTPAWTTHAVAVLAGTAVAAAVGVLCCRTAPRRGIAEGLVAAVAFWALTLVGAWVLGPGPSPLEVTVLLGVPAAVLTAGAVTLAWGADPMEHVLATALATAAGALPLLLWICSTNVVQEAELRRDLERVGSLLTSQGVQPLLPEIDGFTLGDDRGRLSSAESSSSYDLEYWPEGRDDDERAQHEDELLVVSVSAAGADGLCSPGSPECRSQSGYAVDVVNGSTRVVVHRGGTRLVAELPRSGAPEVADVAEALDRARPTGWHTLLAPD